MPRPLLGAHGSDADSPLNSVRGSPTAPWSYILPSDLTARICSALALHPDPAYAASNVSIRSTRAGGAMTLLCAGVDSDRIRLLGCWRSDEMYCYLYVQAQPVMTSLAAAMLRGGSFRLSPLYPTLAFAPPSLPLAPWPHRRQARYRLWIWRVQ